MHSEEAVTRFLNVDLDIRGDAGDINNFLSAIEPSVTVLNHSDQFAAIELAGSAIAGVDSLEGIVMRMVDLIGGLQPDAKRIWNRLDLRSLNVGIQAACEPYSANFSISAKAVELIASLQFEIVLTVYAPRAN